MQVDVDMSGRVEETNRPTALAMANGLKFSIRISAADKREVIDTLSRQRPYLARTRIHILVFTALLYLLVKGHIEKLRLVIVDPEYPGHEAAIKSQTLTFLRRQGIKVFKDQITFQRVTKKSPAHKLAYQVFKGVAATDRVITAEELLKEF